jgi:hypothetical protein
MYPDGEIGWLPKDVDLPTALFIPFRNDIQ